MFLHGDSEYALRTFALHASMLMACDWRIQMRKRTEQQESSVAAEEPPALPNALPIGA